MKLLIQSILLFFFVNIAHGNIINQDIVFIDTMYVSDEAIRVVSDIFSPGQNTKTFTSKNKSIYYAATIGVINPTKKKYEIELICIDAKGKIIIQDKLARSLSQFIKKPKGNIVQSNGIALRLNPKYGKLVSGQIRPLEENDYYVKLYFDKKLIGMTKFHYAGLK